MFPIFLQFPCKGRVREARLFRRAKQILMKKFYHGVQALEELNTKFKRRKKKKVQKKDPCKIAKVILQLTVSHLMVGKKQVFFQIYMVFAKAFPHFDIINVKVMNKNVY